MRRFSGGLVGKRTRGAVGAWGGARRGRPAGRRGRAGGRDDHADHATPTPARRAGAVQAAADRGLPPWAPQGRGLRCRCRPPATRSATGDAASGLVPFPRDGTAFLVLSTGDATAADQPDQPGVVPERRRRRRPAIRSAATRALRRDGAADPVHQPAGPAGAPLGLPLVRLPLPVGGVPRAARQRLQRRLRRRARHIDLDDVGLRRSRRPNNFASLSERPAADDQVGRAAAMSPAEAAGTPYGAATALLHAQVAGAGPATAHALLSSRSSTTATAPYDSAVFIDNLHAHDAGAGDLRRGADRPRPGRRDHRARPSPRPSTRRRRRSPARPATRRATRRR